MTSFMLLIDLQRRRCESEVIAISLTDVASSDHHNLPLRVCHVACVYSEQEDNIFYDYFVLLCFADISYCRYEQYFCAKDFSVIHWLCFREFGSSI